MECKKKFKINFPIPVISAQFQSTKGNLKNKYSS